MPCDTPKSEFNKVLWTQDIAGISSGFGGVSAATDAL
jgi:hypothetical protein